MLFNNDYIFNIEKTNYLEKKYSIPIIGNKVKAYKLAVKKNSNDIYLLKFHNYPQQTDPEFNARWDFLINLNGKLLDINSDSLIIPYYCSFNGEIVEYQKFECSTINILNERLNELQKFYIFKKMAVVFESLHNKKIIYNDFSLDNFLFCKINDRISVKLIDFSDSFFFDNIPEVITNHSFYQSPEIELYNEYQSYGIRQKKSSITEKSDVFSLGLIFYEIYTGEPLKTENGSDPYFIFLSGEKLNLVKIRNLFFKNILSSMLNSDYKKRPKMSEVREKIFDIIKNKKYN